MVVAGLVIAESDTSGFKFGLKVNPEISLSQILMGAPRARLG